MATSEAKSPRFLLNVLNNPHAFQTCDFAGERREDTSGEDSYRAPLQNR